MAFRAARGVMVFCLPTRPTRVLRYTWIEAHMFTGLVEEQGTVLASSRRADGLRITIRAKVVAEGLSIGDSVAVNGCCLTVVELLDDGFSVELVPETVQLTTFATCMVGERVNLERAMRLGDRLDGHMVQGHVDGVAEVLHLHKLEDGSARLRVRVPDDLAALVAYKGSVTLSGVSLTVAEVRGAEVEVALVPHTLEMTNLGGLISGMFVQTEVDVIARYLQRQLEMTGKAPS